MILSSKRAAAIAAGLAGLSITGAITVSAGVERDGQEEAPAAISVLDSGRSESAAPDAPTEDESGDLSPRPASA